ncbi:MAG TPA: hypothetical protein VGL81_28895 [Polyangiaceae bacterium]
MLRRFVFRALLLAPVLVLSACQSCVADSSEPQDLSQSHTAPGASPGRFRPRPMTPVGRLLLRDAGAGDE